MCTGIEIALVAGTLLSAGAAVYQGQTAKKTGEVNAEIARRQGEDNKDAAVAQAEKIRKAAQRQAGEANASLAASGVAIGEGTPILINEQIYKDGENDAYSTLLSGTRGQHSANEQASIMSWQGGRAQTAGYISATGSLLSGVAASQQSGWKSSGSSSTGSGGGTGFNAPRTGFWAN